MQELNLTLDKENKELVIREGKAPIIHEKVILEHNGVISSPGDYYEQRMKRYSENEELKKTIGGKVFSNCVIVVDSEEGSIEFIENQEDHFSTKIKGVLKFDDQFKSFGINSGSKHSLRQLALFLKQKKVFFKDPTKADATVQALFKQKAKVTKDITSNDDLRGNIQKYFEQKLEGSTPLKFELNIPLYKGDVKRTFEVEIIFDVVNEEIKGYLESSALFEIQYNLQEELLNKELLRFKSEAILNK